VHVGWLDDGDVRLLERPGKPRRYRYTAAAAAYDNNTMMLSSCCTYGLFSYEVLFI